MFIQWQQLVQLQKEHSQDRLREFERRQVVGQVLAGRDREDHFATCLLIWLGRRLVTWGQWLQTHYPPTIDRHPTPVAKKLGCPKSTRERSDLRAARCVHEPQTGGKTTWHHSQHVQRASTCH